MNKLTIDVKKLMMTNSGERYLDFKGEINDNEFICLVGYSGCGKTTLLRMLAGLTSPDEGCIKYGDDYWYEHKSKFNLAPQKRHIAYMFQDFALFPNMTVYQNIVFAQSETNHDKIKELINIFGLNNLEKVRPARLSGGQKQRVALARALASQPRIDRKSVV